MVLYSGGSHNVLESGRPSQRLNAFSRLSDLVECWINTEVQL
jgi:hypothetical protein